MNKLIPLFENETLKQQLLIRLESFKKEDKPLYNELQAFNSFVLSIEYTMLMFLQGRYDKLHSNDIELFKEVFSVYLPNELKKGFNPGTSICLFKNEDHNELVLSVLDDIWKDYVSLYTLPIINKKENFFTTLKNLFK